MAKRIISKKMEESLNVQIVNELFSSNAYLAIAAYMDSLGLKVMANRFFLQSEEERDHALKLLKYLLSVGAGVRIGAIPEPKNSFKSVEDAVECSLTQEEVVTKQINDLMTLAHKEDDYATASFLKWFVDEQVEELSTVGDLLQLIRLAGPERILMVEDRLLRMGFEPEAEEG